MRLLIYGLNFFPEEVGIGKYTGEMTQWLAQHGYEVRVVTTAPHFPRWKTFPGYCAWTFTNERLTFSSNTNNVSTNVTVIRCPAWIPSRAAGWQRILYLTTFAASSALAMFKQIFWSPDIMLAIEPTLFCGPVAIACAKLADASALLHIQDFEIDAAFQIGGLSSSKLKKLALFFERILSSKFDCVTTISPRMLERLGQKKIQCRSTAIFPNWVDTSAIYPLEHVSPLRKELGIPENAVVALYSGSMGAKHGLQLLIDASRCLSDRDDIFFVFCGEGPFKAAMQMEKRSNQIHLPLQPYDRLNDLLNLADIHLLPQLPNAADLVMPSKLTGMMASGRAIVATALPGTHISAVLEGRGIVTPPGDLQSFVTAILQCAEDSNLRRTLGERARSYATREMDREQILRRFEALLQKIGNGKVKTPGPRTHNV